MLNLPLCQWSSQLFDLRAPSSTDVPVLLLNQPIKFSNGTKRSRLDQVSIFLSVCIKVAQRDFFGGGNLPSLSINHVAVIEDMGKRLPQLYCIKMKISYDLGFIAIGVAIVFLCTRSFFKKSLKGVCKRGKLLWAIACKKNFINLHTATRLLVLQFLLVIWSTRTNFAFFKKPLDNFFFINLIIPRLIANKYTLQVSRTLKTGKVFK